MSRCRKCGASWTSCVVNLKGLNELVRERIDATNALDAVMARLPSLAARVRNVADEAIISEQARNQRCRRDDLRCRPGALGRVVGGGPGMHYAHAGRAGRAQYVAPGAREIRAQVLVERMEDVRAQLPPPCSPKSAACTTTSPGSGSAPKASPSRGAVQIETESAIQTALRLIQQTSAAFVASVSAIANATQRDIGSRSAYFNETVSHFTLLSIATSFLCLAAGTAIFVYVRRAVIARLKVLQQYMRAQVEGRPAAIPIAGEDEITEMATATEFFVTELTKRQEALAAAKEAAEAARDVAERARAEAAAARADVELTREVLQTVLDNMSDGIVLFDKDYRLKFINHQLMSFQRYPSEVTRPGTSIYDLLRFQAKRGDFGPPEDVDRIVQEWAALVLKPGGNRYERYTASGRHVQFNFKPVEGGGLLAVSRDITELKEREEALAAAKKAAEIARDARRTGAHRG